MRQGPNSRRSRGRGSNNPGRRSNLPNRNQTFDSNGPDVRIRGNAHQVYEKYLGLARDASAAGDRIMAENYLQHAEHYHRIIIAMNEAYAQAQQQQFEQSGHGGDREDGREPMPNGRDVRREMGRDGRDQQGQRQQHARDNARRDETAPAADLFQDPRQSDGEQETQAEETPVAETPRSPAPRGRRGRRAAEPAEAQDNGSEAEEDRVGLERIIRAPANAAPQPTQEAAPAAADAAAEAGEEAPKPRRRPGRPRKTAAATASGDATDRKSVV